MLSRHCLLFRANSPSLPVAVRLAATRTMGRKQHNAVAHPQTKSDGKQKQEQQRQPQQRQEKPSGGMQHYSSFLQVLALDIDHTSPSVLLFFDKERYLFNAGEGIQRYFREHRLRIKQVNSYFVTRISTETLGGLPGMALSVAPADGAGFLDRQAACTVKGPRGLKDYVSAFRSYLNPEATVAFEEIDPVAAEPILKTDVVSITPIVVPVGPKGGPSGPMPASSPPPRSPRQQHEQQPPQEPLLQQQGEETVAVEAAEEASGSPASCSPACKRQRTDDGSGAAVAVVAKQPQPEEAEAQQSPREGKVETAAEDSAGRSRPAGLSSPDVVAYVVQLAGRPGRFDPKKAAALGLRPGPMFGTLQSGCPVTAPDGRVVSPHEVMEPAVPGPCVLLLDTPCAASLRAVAADERVRKVVAEAAASDATSGSALRVVVHLAPAAVASDAAAMEPLRSLLGPSWRHVLVTCGPQQPSSGPRASVFQARLHALNPTVFPLIALDNAAAPPQLPEGAAAAVPSPAGVDSGAGKGGSGGGAGGAQVEAATTATAAGSKAKTAPQPLPLVPRQQPVLPLEAGSVVPLMSAVRLNLMPPGKQGLEYGDVLQYDSSSKVLEEMRADPVYGDILAAAAAATTEAGSSTEAEASTAEAAEAPPPPPEARDDGVDGGADDEVPSRQEGAASETEPSPADVDVDMADGPGPVAEEVPVPEAVASGNRRLAELTFLGTASSQPSKFRNVSGCYVDLFDRGGLLVDCGEDAMGQMKRRFGPAEAEARLLALSMVWVSHMHADHHGGLYRLLEWRARRRAPPLLVVGPFKIFEVLVRYSSVIPMQFVFLSNAALSRPGFGRGPPPSVLKAFEVAKRRLGLAAVAPFPVEHTADAYGLKLQGQAGWSIVFSGDTRPCEGTVAAARGATLLVHEATFEEEMAGEARAKRHSTTAEAVSVGEQAGAYRILLTHFSTRYPTLPELDLSPHPRVAVAMDLMSVNLADLPWLPRLVRPMGLLFKQLEELKMVDGDDDD